MFNAEFKLSEDQKTALLTLPNMLAPLSMNTEEVSDLIRHLAWLRTSMIPPHEAVDLKPETQTSSVPAIRYQVVQDDVPEQCRLFLLHPGFGWLHIHLTREAVSKIATDAQIFLQAPTSTQ